jgi:hypothetical protein
MRTSAALDQFHQLVLGAEEMFGQVLLDVEPYDSPSQLVHLLFFRRFTEWQLEYCRAIRLLYEADCVHGAIPVLRSLVEVSVAQIHLHQDVDFSVLLEVLNGERIKTDGALKTINWPAGQSDIYARLSRMTHASRTSAFLGRTLDFEADPLKSLVAQKDIAGVAGVILWEASREDDEARRQRWAFIALNTFDLTISCLFTLYGAAAPEYGWWDLSCISLFEYLAEQYSMKQDLLWFRLPWQHSKESRMQKNLREILDGNEAVGASTL